ncbi:hypothetical protein QWA68_016639, partial [Fusarium oxysporum]
MWWWLRFQQKYQFIPFLANLRSGNQNNTNSQLTQRYPPNPLLSERYPFFIDLEGVE